MPNKSLLNRQRTSRILIFIKKQRTDDLRVQRLAGSEEGELSTRVIREGWFFLVFGFWGLVCFWFCFVLFGRKLTFQLIQQRYL